MSLVMAGPLLLASQPALATSQDDWATASDIGVSSLVLWSIGVPAAKGDTHGALLAGASAAVGFGVAQGLKQVFPEMRPDRSGNDSFPSGHTATAFAAATSIPSGAGRARAFRRSRSPASSGWRGSRRTSTTSTTSWQARRSAAHQAC